MKAIKDSLCLPDEKIAELEGVYERVAMGLHAASQPLTVLRAGWWPEGIADLTPSELRELAETSANALERTCILFNLTRELVNVVGIQRCANRFDLAAAVQAVTERFSAECEQFSRSLEISVEQQLPWVLGDSALASKAIAIALKLTQSALESGGVIHITACTSACQVKLSVWSPHSRPNTTDVEMQLNLSLMEAILAKQCASFSYELNPFELRVLFKSVQRGSEHNERHRSSKA